MCMRGASSQSNGRGRNRTCGDHLCMSCRTPRHSGGGGLTMYSRHDLRCICMSCAVNAQLPTAFSMPNTTDTRYPQTTTKQSISHPKLGKPYSHNEIGIV